MFERLEGRQLMSAVPLAAPAGSAKLSGAILGTAGSYQNKGNTVANVFDGNTGTYFDAPTATGDWAGLDLGTAEQVTQVQFVPRSGYAGRMVGGVFQASATADFSAGVTTLLTVATVPASGKYTAVAVNVSGAFEFVRYLAPAGSNGNVAEIEFDGYAPATAVPNAPAAPVATASYAGVQLAWPADPSSVVSSYTVERQGPTDVAPVVIGTTAAGATMYTDATAAASTAYSYQVVANNSLGASAPSAAVTVTTPAGFVNAWTDADIGSPAKTGSAVVNPAGPITVAGGGADIWNSTDAFNYESQPLVGNGSIVAQVTAQTNTNGWAKSGIMVRETAHADSRYVLLALTPGNGITMQARTATHATPAFSTGTAGKAGVWLQLTRVGSTFTGSISTDGVTWRAVGTVSIPMVNNVLAGLAVTAHDNTKLSTGTFGNVAITAAGVAASAWSDAAAAPMTRWESETFSYGGKLYAFGGFIDRNLDATAECDVYDPAANAWTDLTTVPTGALTHASVAVVGDTVYFAGGDLGTFTGGKTSTSTAEVLSYDLTTNAWGAIMSLPAASSCGGLVYINNHLIYYGGLNATDTADLSATWSLDLANPAAGWVAAAAMPDARNHIGGVEINGIAYAVGGGHLYNESHGNDAEVDAYDPVANVWTRVAALPVPMSSNETTTLVVNGKIVVVGGQTNGGYDGIYLNTIQAYDPTANAWSQPGTLPEANEGESVAYVNGTLIVADGTVDNLGGWSQDQVWVTAIAL